MEIQFKLNGKIEIQVDEKNYKSNIQNITKDTLLVSLPMKDGLFITPLRGEILEIFYQDDLYTYKFSSKVIGRVIENNIPMLSIEYPKKVARIQRREFVRISIMHNIVYKKLEEKHDKSGIYAESEKMEQGTLLDLSGGGFRFSSRGKLKIKDIIMAKLEFINDDEVVTGEIVRAEQVDNTYVYGVNFMNLGESVRDKIISHIFEVMRKQKQAT